MRLERYLILFFRNELFFMSSLEDIYEEISFTIIFSMFYTLSFSQLEFFNLFSIEDSYFYVN